MTSNKVTMRRLGGSHEYTWAVLVDGRVKYSGLSKKEASYRKIKVQETLSTESIRKLAMLNLLGGVKVGIQEAKCEGTDADILEEVLRHVTEATELLRGIERME